MTTLLIATRNAHKTGEIRAILGGQFQFLTLNDFPDAPKVVEDADTFAGNATKKAVELAKWFSCHSSLVTRHSFVLADDSGLEVDALDGTPGVHSARFAALDKTENSSDADNNAKLLRLLKDVPLEKRTARFHCVIALGRCRREKLKARRRYVLRMNLKRKFSTASAKGKSFLNLAEKMVLAMIRCLCRLVLVKRLPN